MTLLDRMVKEKYVSVQKHPTEELFIYNYSPRAQYDRLWNEATMSARGLILDAEYNIVARPFRKFFNIEEHEAHEMPNLPFNVFDKLDGSLGILYWVNGMPFIATRGSFESPQAIIGTQILYDRYLSLCQMILPNQQTFLFEIIYPDNRIVIDYGKKEDLILLAVLDNATGKDIHIPDIGFPIVKRYDGVKDYRQLKQRNEDNKEGFVIKFENGFRIKIKYEEYVRLHRIVTNVSNRVIWEHLRDKQPLDEMLDRVPDEFYNWVKDTSTQLQSEFDDLFQWAQDIFDTASASQSRKEYALWATSQKYPSLLFGLLDKRDISPLIWKIIKPSYSRPFKKEI